MAPDLDGPDEPGAAIDVPAEAKDATTASDQETVAESGAEPRPESPDPATGERTEPSPAEPGEAFDESAGAEPEETRDVSAGPALTGPSGEPAAVPALTRIRVLTFLAVGPLLTGYLAIAALLALVTAIASNADFTTTGVLSAALPSWLAAQQVPVSVFGLELGVLPLLPTIGVAALTARAAARAAERLELRRPRQAGVVIGTVAAAHATAGVVVAILSSGAEVSVEPLAALYYPALVSSLAATLGVARRCGLLGAVADRADTAAVAGLRAGALAVVLLLTAGGAVLTFGLLTSIATARDLFPMGAGNAAGMLLLSIGYLPNAVIAATSFVAGPGFSLGEVMVSPLEFNGGRTPGVPLLAALPEQQAAWWPALFVLPLAVGIVVGRRLRDVDEDPVARLRAVAVATGVVAMCFVVLAGSAGGRLGRGTFDPVSMRAVALSIALVLWTAVPAAFAAWFGGPRPVGPLPGLIDDDSVDELEEEAEEADEPEPPSDLPGPRDAVEESGEVARD
jgi:hypothetical protein